jgi:hypothetical protein
MRFRRMDRDAVRSLELPEDELLVPLGGANTAGVFPWASYLSLAAFSTPNCGRGMLSNRNAT